MEAFDLQVNGYAGVDFNDDELNAEKLATVCDALKEDGVAGILATVITDDIEVMCGRIQRLVKLRQHNAEWSQMIRGIHIEGPFLNENPGYIGAHPIAQARPAEISAMDRLLEAAEGLTRIVTLAPERDQGFPVTKYLADQGVCVAAGHCDPSLAQLRGAIDAGLRMFTHLGNGCPMNLHRHDNIIQRVLSLREDLWISFIPDGAHVPFATLKNYLDLLGPERVVMVTDAIAAARMGPGDYRFLGREVKIGEDLVARAPDGSHLIGSTVTMPRIAENLSRELGFSEEDIRKVLVENPRTLIGETK
ncbi:N-acetylglucosamine-6-phosphate deacetylase [Verrucomicrobiaceae bacterium 227]